MAAQAEWECSICYQLLLDPVVGKCGHDFCKECLLSWASTQEHGSGGGGTRAISCPLCRNELAQSVEGVKRLGVCIRLKQMIENLYPQQVAQRRRERQQEELKGVAAQRSRAQQTIREGRSRYLRARRTRPSQPNSSMGTPPLNQATPSAQLSLQQLANGIHLTFMTLPSGQGSPAAVAADAGSRQGAADGSWAVWSVPHMANFTMGWFEPAKDGRRKRAARSNRSPAHPLLAGVHHT